MSGDGGLRVGPWVPEPDDSRSRHSVRPGQPTGREWWEDQPDPWDRTQPTTEPAPEAALDIGDEHGAPRTGHTNEADSSPPVREAMLRRGAVIVVLVGVVLIGSGALANMLRPEPSALPLPPTSPPERLIPTTPEREVGLEAAPSPTAVATETAAPVVTAPPPAPEPEPSPSPTPEPPASPTAVSLSFEAEDAELAGSASSYEVAAASGGHAVGNLGRWGFNHVRFPSVTVPRDGEYEVTFHYLSTRDRTGHYAVNGGGLRAVEFPRLAQGSVGTVTVTVRLTAGENTV